MKTKAYVRCEELRVWAPQGWVLASISRKGKAMKTKAYVTGMLCCLLFVAGTAQATDYSIQGGYDPENHDPLPLLTELFLNPGFEVSYTPWGRGYTEQTAYDTDNARSGSGCASFKGGVASSTPYWIYLKGFFVCHENEMFDFSIWYKTVDFGEGDHLHVRLFVFDTDATLISYLWSP